MLTPAGQDLPTRVGAQFEPQETQMATLHGLQESGFTLTDRRVFAWRGTGASAPLPLAAIDRILVDLGPGSEHIDLVVLPRQAVNPPLVLAVRISDRVKALAFVERLVAMDGREPVTEHLGAVLRFSFPRPLRHNDRLTLADVPA